VVTAEELLFSQYQPHIQRLSTTRVKVLDPVTCALSLYEADIEVNQQKLRMFYSDKGRGICTMEAISEGQAVCEYLGKQINLDVAANLEERYATEGKGCYIYHVELENGDTVCLDATAEDGMPGRLINHSLLNGNLRPKKVSIGGVIRLFFLAKQRIPPNRELLYDYGERTADATSFLRKSPMPVDVNTSQFCSNFSLSQVHPFVLCFNYPTA
jgi:hypothetical protein